MLPCCKSASLLLCPCIALSQHLLLRRKCMDGLFLTLLSHCAVISEPLHTENTLGAQLVAQRGLLLWLLRGVGWCRLQGRVRPFAEAKFRTSFLSMPQMVPCRALLLALRPRRARASVCLQATGYHSETRLPHRLISWSKGSGVFFRHPHLPLRRHPPSGK